RPLDLPELDARLRPPGGSQLAPERPYGVGGVRRVARVDALALLDVDAQRVAAQLQEELVQPGGHAGAGVADDAERGERDTVSAQGTDAGHDPLVRRLSGPVDPLRGQVGWAVDGQPDAYLMILKEAAPGVVDLRRVGLDVVLDAGEGRHQR